MSSKTIHAAEVQNSELPKRYNTALDRNDKTAKTFRKQQTMNRDIQNNNKQMDVPKEADEPKSLELEVPNAQKEKQVQEKLQEQEKTKAQKESQDHPTESLTLKEVIAEQAREDEEPQSTTFTLRKILGGDILSAQLIRSQIWLIIIIVFFIIIYISNRYSVQKDLLEISNLNEQLQDAKYKALSSTSQLTEKCRESHVLEMLQQSNDTTLKIAEQPPYFIEVPK